MGRQVVRSCHVLLPRPRSQVQVARSRGQAHPLDAPSPGTGGRVMRKLIDAIAFAAVILSLAGVAAFILAESIIGGMGPL